MSQLGNYVSYEHLRELVDGKSYETVNARKMPQLRVARVTNLEDNASRRAWGHYLDYMGEATRMIGSVRVFGQLAVTYCSAQELDRRLSDQYPCFTNRDYKRSLATVITLARDYNSFVRESANETVESQNLSISDNSTGDDENYHWLNAGFKLQDRYETLDNNRILLLNFQPRSRRILEREIGLTEKFFKGAGLVKGKVKPKIPHLSILKLFDPLGTVEVKNIPDIPTDINISLLSPHAFVAENRPPQA